MLIKLLKHDLKNIYKFLIIFYILAVVFGILTRIFLGIENSLIMNIIGQICNGASISMMCSVLINNLMRIWVRFKQNIYGDESYLTHTLPIEKKEIYLSKVLTAIISLFTSILVIALVLFIEYYSKENIEAIKNILLPIATAYNSTIIKIIIAFLFVFFLEFVNALQAGFSGIILGHKMNNGKTGFSVLFGFITYTTIQMITLLMAFIIALFDKEIMNLFITNELVSIDAIKKIISISMIIYTLDIFACYIVNKKIFEKGVNVE